MKRVKSLILISILALSTILSSSCTNENHYLKVSTDTGYKEVIDQLNKYMDKNADVYHFSGSILIAKDGEILLNQGYGMADYENSIPNTPKTVYEAGSLTKQFTAMAVLILQERGLLDVQDALNEYISDYPKGDKIRLHNLLTHTSGIKDYTLMMKDNQWGQHMSPEELISMFKNEDFDFEPDTNFEYSNSNYILLGYIIEKVSGSKYEDYVRENIIKPLNMKDSSFNTKDVEVKYKAIGYSTIYPEPTKSMPLDMSIPYAAGALCTTTEELYKWDRALYEDKLVSKAAINDMLTPYKRNYGYGWGIEERDGDKVVLHNGATIGFNSYIERNISDNSVIIILSNQNQLDIVHKISSGISYVLNKTK